ncbi:hypothetical protein O181_068899 [Austropuccinia psidii MF-1]|uniref:Uncharacterized protein n=1 Tax=Austropuccinia psidii MF-1 TaxID=1389203 RepID=A0A9Q3EXS0_9BASI|nr:hypothetical protein [Austropuccinia psidii MF-1]
MNMRQRKKIGFQFQKKYMKTSEQKEIGKENFEMISKEENKEIQKQDSQKMELRKKAKYTVNKKNPIIDKKVNLTIEEMLSISQNIDQKLPNSTIQKKDGIKSVNESNIQERVLSLKLPECDTPMLHYACQLRYMEVFIRRE